jgi:hypothetical protein
VSAAVQGAVSPRYGEVRIRDRGYLPHWEKESGLYFVTFRLVDSLPKEVSDKLVHLHRILKTAKSSGIKLSPSQEAAIAEYSPKRIEEYVDNGEGACYLRDPRIAAVIEEALRSADKRSYALIAWCVMPNHVHVVFRLLPGDLRTKKLEVLFGQSCESDSGAARTVLAARVLRPLDSEWRGVGSRTSICRHESGTCWLEGLEVGLV